MINYPANYLFGLHLNDGENKIIIVTEKNAHRKLQLLFRANVRTF